MCCSLEVDVERDVEGDVEVDVEGGADIECWSQRLGVAGHKVHVTTAHAVTACVTEARW